MPLPALTQSDLCNVDEEHYDDLHNPPHPTHPIDNEPDHFGDEEELPTEAKERMYQDAPLYRSLASLIRRTFPIPRTYHGWGWPTTGALSSFSPALFDESAWHPSQRARIGDKGSEESTLLASESTQSFEDGRDQSEDGVAQTRDRDHVRDNVLAYFKRITATRTPENESNFQKICRNMCGLCSRPNSIDQLHTISFKVIIDNVDLFQDNWWYRRRILLRGCCVRRAFLRSSSNPYMLLFFHKTSK